MQHALSCTGDLAYIGETSQPSDQADAMPDWQALSSSRTRWPNTPIPSLKTSNSWSSLFRTLANEILSTMKMLECGDDGRSDRDCGEDKHRQQG